MSIRPGLLVFAASGVELLLPLAALRGRFRLRRDPHAGLVSVGGTHGLLVCLER